MGCCPWISRQIWYFYITILRTANYSHSNHPIKKVWFFLVVWELHYVWGDTKKVKLHQNVEENHVKILHLKKHNNPFTKTVNRDSSEVW